MYTEVHVLIREPVSLMYVNMVKYLLPRASEFQTKFKLCNVETTFLSTKKTTAVLPQKLLGTSSYSARCDPTTGKTNETAF